MEYQRRGRDSGGGEEIRPGEMQTIQTITKTDRDNRKKEKTSNGKEEV